MQLNEDDQHRGPSAERLAQIDALSRAWREDLGSEERQSALWREVFGLDTWFFIPRGNLEMPNPLALEFAEGPAVLAFTTTDRARAAGQAIGLPEEENQHVLGVPMPNAIDWLAGFAASGVQAAVFDYPSQGYTCQLANLMPIREWLHRDSA